MTKGIESDAVSLLEFAKQHDRLLQMVTLFLESSDDLMDYAIRTEMVAALARDLMQRADGMEPLPYTNYPIFHGETRCYNHV